MVEIFSVTALTVSEKVSTRMPWLTSRLNPVNTGRIWSCTKFVTCSPFVPGICTMAFSFMSSIAVELSERYVLFLDVATSVSLFRLFKSKVPMSTIM